MLNHFLTRFQSDGPMVPFLADVLEDLFRRLMKFLLLKKIVNDADTQYKPVKHDIEDSAKHPM